MSAYIVSRVRILDREAMQRYVTEAPETVAAFGGRYLVRGNDVQALEGAWEHERMVVVEFPDKEAALAWYHSDVYRPLRELRQRSASTVILLAEGVPDAHES
ncbi:MAG TPA: DUF1330 domain-containing protein [Thermoanaerobaculia bacterium]|nr:DUF1330 domain-containing protein [Thermoanaerobaculia bacterium]